MAAGWSNAEVCSYQERGRDVHNPMTELDGDGVLHKPLGGSLM